MKSRSISARGGWAVRSGTSVDATIIAAPFSTAKATGTRDPAMHQTQKGRQWYFGMKGHFGVDDSQSKLVQSVNGASGAIRRRRGRPAC
jgi:hypothetical protein